MNENRNRPRNDFYSERNQETSSIPSDLIRKEQDYRHQWQDKYLKSNTMSFRLGQVFGLIYNLALLYLVYDLIQDGEKNLALKIFFSNIAIIAFALLVTSLERKIISRKPPRRMRNDKRPNRNPNQNRNRDRNDNRGEFRDQRN